MELIYSDSDIAVCVKSLGLESEKEVPQALSRLLGGEIYPVHRLDKNVGGVMVYARTRAAAAALSRAVQAGSLVKEYAAMVHGTPPQAGDWEDLLFKDSEKNKVFVVQRERKGVKKARLEYRLVRGGPESLVHIRLHTGRSHQIRVQFASRGFPLVGDHKYGSRDSHSAPLLYSCRITLPYKGQKRCWEAFPDWGEAFVQFPQTTA